MFLCIVGVIIVVLIFVIAVLAFTRVRPFGWNDWNFAFAVNQRVAINEQWLPIFSLTIEKIRGCVNGI